jgi:hypothetical protein
MSIRTRSAVQTTYEEEGKIEVRERCPTEEELHGVVDELDLQYQHPNWVLA